MIHDFWNRDLQLPKSESDRNTSLKASPRSESGFHSTLQLLSTSRHPKSPSRGTIHHVPLNHTSRIKWFETSDSCFTVMWCERRALIGSGGSELSQWSRMRNRHHRVYALLIKIHIKTTMQKFNFSHKCVGLKKLNVKYNLSMFSLHTFKRLH